MKRFLVPLVLGVLATAWALGSGTHPAGAALFVPSPIYSIDAVSGTHHASVLNLPIGQPGVVLAPIPVDVNGDLLPDVAVTVSVVDVGGVSNPPSPAIVSPNIRIDRLLTAVLLGQPSPPLRITANLTVVDVQGGQPNLRFRFGYDTGTAGSIPNTLSAVLGGLTSGFDPLTASVDTHGLIRGVDPGPTHYQGPLTLLAGFDQGTDTTNAELAYRPFPGKVDVSFGSGPAGDRITYAHGSDDLFSAGAVPEVDLTTRITQVDAEGRTDISATIDRLPRRATLDIGEGAFDLVSRSDGRRPDLEVKLRQVKPGDLLDVRAEVDGVPDELHGSWALPEDDDEPARLRFESPDGIGAVEARVSDSDDTSAIEPFVPTERQYVSFQERNDARLITGRVEGISLAAFAEVERGFDASFESASGGLPLQLHADVDKDDDTSILADSTIRPLPDTIDVHVRKAGDDEATEPLTVTYDASSSVDVQADLQVREADAAVGAGCGDAAVTCASLQARQVPAHIEARVAKVENDDDHQEIRVDVDATDPGSVAPDVIADVTAGQDEGRPIVAHLDALAIPEEMRARIVQGAADSIEEASLTSSAPIGLVAFGARNFVEADRPADLPPPLPIAENGATVAARGRGPDLVDFEAIGRLQDVAGFRFVNRDSFGLHAEVGGGGDLVADVDLRNVDLDDDDPKTGAIDVIANAVVHPVPTSLDVCFRSDGQAVAQAGDGDALLEPCQVEPADDDAPAPLAVSYRASTPVESLTADFDLLARGNAPARDNRIRATLGVQDVPTILEAQVQSKTDDQPLVVHADTGGQPPPTSLAFAFEDLDADLECKDPRNPIEGVEALCVTADIDPVPAVLDLTYDEAAPVDNVVVTTDRTIDLTDFELSKVAHDDVLVVNADVTGIPSELRATIQAPDLPADAPEGVDAPLGVAFRATPAIERVDATVRTYLGPDPFGPVPGQRAGLPPVTADFDTVTLRQSGDALLAEVHASGVEGAGYRTGVGTDGFRFPAHAVDLRIGEGSDVRAYVDTDDGTDRMIADVTAVDLPADLQACFRGELPIDRTLDVPDEGASFCETAAGDKALFELSSDAGTGPRPDVHAYFRSAKNSGVEVLSGRLDVTDLPPLLRGVIGDGADGDGVIGEDTTAVVSALAADGTTTDHIGRIEAHVATFDIDDHGYAAAELPFSLVQPASGPFPVARTTGQQVAVASGDGLFEAVAVVGPTATEPGSSFERLSLTSEPCGSDAVGNPGDYPAYTDADAAAIEVKYTCAQLDVDPVGSADPLALSFVKEEGGERIALRDAGISDVPTHVQLTLSDTSGLVPASIDPNEPLRKRCGTLAHPEPEAGGTVENCLPPMLRFDADSAPGAVLWGQMELGQPGAITDVTTAEHQLTVPELDLAAAPTIDGWTDGSAPFGLRAVLGTVLGTDGDETVGRIGVRLRLPDSVTFEHLQSWDTAVQTPESGDDPAVDGEAKDIRLGYTVRRDGQIEPDLGRLALLHVNGDGDELVLSDVVGAPLKANASSGGLGGFLPRPASGIPGQLDLTFSLRENKLFGSQFIQADGRVNTATDLRLQLQKAPEPEPANPPPPPDDESGGLTSEKAPHPLHVDALILNLPGPKATGDDGGPTFRLRAEVMKPNGLKPGEDPSPPDSCPGNLSFDGCTVVNAAPIEIQAILDFQPTGPTGQVPVPARQVRLVAQTDGSHNGIQVQAFKEVDAAADATPDAVVTVQGRVLLDPFNVFVDKEAIIGIQIELDARFEPVLLLDRVSDFRLRAVQSVITTENVSHGLGEGQAAVIPVTYIEDFDADVTLDLWLTEVTLLGIDWINPLDLTGYEGAQQVAMDYESCSGLSRFLGAPIEAIVDTAFLTVDDAILNVFGFGAFTTTGITVSPQPAGHAQTMLVTPRAENDPRFVLHLLGFPVSSELGGVIMNLLDGIFLCEDPDSTALIGPNTPGDTFKVTGHEIPGAPDGVDLNAPTPDPQPTAPLTVPAGETLDLCGHGFFGDVRIEGKLRFRPGCSSSALAAEDLTVVNGGSIEANGDLQVLAESITVEPGGRIDQEHGNLQVVAADSMAIGGTIDATGASDEMPIDPDTGEPFLGAPLGGGGAGHGGAGGADGLFAPGGDPYGDQSDASLDVEPGSPGGNHDRITNGGSNGGGSVVLQGHDITITGSVIANGADVPSSPICGGFDGPGGGGSGGGIAVLADAVALTGTLVANGGAGGPGASVGSTWGIGGGGGAGGVVKVRAGVFTGTAPATPTGGPGFTTCDPDPNEHGEDGQPGGLGVAFVRTDGGSTIKSIDEYWQAPGSDERVDIDVTASVPARGSANDFTVFTCVLSAGLGNGEVPDERLWKALMPTLPGDGFSPCGYRPSPFGGGNPPIPAGSVRGPAHFFENQTTLTESNGGSLRVDVSGGDRHWAVWTVVATSTSDGDQCLGASTTCRYELSPALPDVVFGADSELPDIDPIVIGGERAVEGAPGVFHTGSRDITLVAAARDQAEKSGLQDIRCVESDLSSGDAVRFPCANTTSAQPYRLQTAGDGRKTILIFATDQAGNVATEQVPVFLDIRTPTAGAVVYTPPPDGANGFYKTAPDFRLVGAVDVPNADGTAGSGIAIPAWAYRVDGSDERPCVGAASCLVQDEIPAFGRHVVRFTAIDRVGNRRVDDHDPRTLPMLVSDPVLVDAVPPRSSLLTSPAAPNGAGGWFTSSPWVVFAAADQIGGAGMVAPEGGSDPDVPGVYYTLDGSALTKFTAPFQLPAGVHTLCWHAVDAAGVAEGSRCETRQVDLADPAVTLAATPAAPNGGGGWYRGSSPTVAASASDAAPGAGVVASTLKVSFDGGPLFTPTGALTVPEGVHDVRAVVSDAAGRRSLVAASSLRVDLSPPVATHRVLPPDPAANGWWRRLPRLVLSATDGSANAGVDRIEYRIGSTGPFVRYTVPIELPSGTTAVTYRAVDRAGIVGASRTLTFPVDVTAPTAVALGASPTIWSRTLALLGLGPRYAQLQYRVSDTQSRTLRVVVLVHDALGNAVRRIDAGPITVTPGVPFTGSVQWDGTDQTLLGFLGIGLYHFRVLVVDEAGNWSESGESKPMQIKLL